MVMRDKLDSNFINYIHKKNLYYTNDWSNFVNNCQINKVLSKASKNQTGKSGYPDYIYVNEQNNLLILAEIKNTIKEHQSTDGLSYPKKYAVDGIKHYLKYFLKENLDSVLYSYFKSWKIVGLAVSGNPEQEYNHQISTYFLKDNKIDEQDIQELLNEEDYILLFENINEEEIINKISIVSKQVNQLLRNIDSQERPTVLSALMVCLFEPKNFSNSFKNDYMGWDSEMIIDNIPSTVSNVLRKEGLPEEKINVFKNLLRLNKNEFRDTDLLKEILSILEKDVIPLFKHKSNYDIIGKFYEEFLTWAGIANVKKGIVLTPHHITELFTELIPMKYTDVVVDTCCGTGAFLIAAMNKLHMLIDNSDIPNKEELKSKVKSEQLIGFEYNETMFALAISNMLFRGDGKSQIYNDDSFSVKADKILTSKNIDIGFINPPYGGQDNKKNPTKKEIQFLLRLLNVCNKYVVMIAPLSTYFKDDKIRSSILKRHTLKAVINMPPDLFQPNASAHTAISVFETHSPHGNKNVAFMELKDDGFMLSKNRGRTDRKNKWQNIKIDFLKKYNNPEKFDDKKTVITTPLDLNKEWLLQAYSEPDYMNLTDNDFISSIKQYMIFKAKEAQNILDKDLDEISLIELLFSYYGSSFNKQFEKDIKVAYSNKNYSLEICQPFYLKDIFDYERGTRLVCADRINGSVPLVTAGYKNSGFAEYINEDDRMTLHHNKITIDMFGNVFYKESSFYCDDNIIAIKPKNIELNKYIAMFLITVLKFSTTAYNYGRQYRLKHFVKHQVKLPAVKNSKGKFVPDWNYMENYTKNLPYSSNL